MNKNKNRIWRKSNFTGSIHLGHTKSGMQLIEQFTSKLQFVNKIWNNGLFSEINEKIRTSSFVQVIKRNIEAKWMGFCQKYFMSQVNGSFNVTNYE